MKWTVTHHVAPWHGIPLIKLHSARRMPRIDASLNSRMLHAKQDDASNTVNKVEELKCAPLNEYKATRLFGEVMDL